MSDVTANSVFLKGFRYMFWIWLVLLSAVFLLSVSVRSEGDIETVNLLIAYMGIIAVALFVSFITAYFIVKKAIEAGELTDINIFTKNGRLSLNIFTKDI